MKYISLKFNYFAAKRQRNIPLNQPSTQLNIAQKYLSVLKTEKLCGFACEALKLVY